MRTIPDPGFADDGGSAPPRLVVALEAYREDPDQGYLPLLGELRGTRLLVPVVAVPGELAHGDDGLAHDKNADVAAVLIQRPDGRRALLAFTSSAALAAWDADARPVPVPVSTAAQSAIQDGADALLVDRAGPVRFVVEGDDLVALARGWRLVRLGAGWGWLTG